MREISETRSTHAESTTTHLCDGESKLISMAHAQIPEDVSADYENVFVQQAIDDFQATPDYEHLASFLTAIREGYLVVDVTGTPNKKSTRIRTIRSTTGQLILPLFTSMHELRQAVASGGRKSSKDQAKGAVMPALEALALIETDRFVAAQFNPASDALVVLRKYVALATAGEPIDAPTLEHMK